MTRKEMADFIRRLNEIHERGSAVQWSGSSDTHTYAMGVGASYLRQALAETGSTMRLRISALCMANHVLATIHLPVERAECDSDLVFLQNAAQIVLTEIVTCAGAEKKHDWRKLYPE